MVKRALFQQLVDAEKERPAPIPVRAVRPGGVIWLACLSVADTKEIAEALKTRLHKDGFTAVVLINNELEGVFATKLDQDATAPLAIARSQGKLCQILAQQGQMVICVNTTMRRQVFDWNRNALPNYMEVHLDGPTSKSVEGSQIIELPHKADLHLSLTDDTSPAHICDAVEAKLEEILFV